ncbi:unnamed protein product [Arabidopsis thaliana]|nr:unnamed protein product [Arabidopsis thaliana]
MNYTSPSPHDSTKQVVEKKEKLKKAEVVVPATESDGDDSVVEKKKKKRKRNQMTDLRFENELAEIDGRSKRKERKKKYWEAKKQKKNKGKTEDTLRENFPKHEQIRFGDVVQAPLKLAVVPKARKSTLSASQERLRLQAIDAYRSRKGWTARPGVPIPAVMMQ